MRQTKTLTGEILDASSRITVNNNEIFNFFQNQPDMAWMVAADATGVWYNKAFYDFSGKTLEDMRDWAWQDFLPVEEIPRVSSSFYHALDTGQNWACLYPQRGHDGKYRQFLVRGVPLYNAQGKIQYWIGNATDVTDYIRPDKLIG